MSRPDAWARQAPAMLDKVMSMSLQRCLCLCLAGLAAGAHPSRAELVNIPNASFESPLMRFPPYATPTIHNWQKSPTPDWWLQEGYTHQDWLNAAGVFYNVPTSTFIDNIDGYQAAFVFSTPGVELYQDLAATYEVGHAYGMTVGFQGGGYGMPLGTPIEIRLYYRNPDGDRVTIAATAVLNTTDESLPHAKHLDDWNVQVPPVRAQDPWAGKNIGVQIVVAIPLDAAGGYWRVDNVRLNSVTVPADFDHDGDVDADDLQFFASCVSGPAVAQPNPACQAAKLDADSDVDQTDFALFQRCYHGRDVPGVPDCLD